MKYRDRGMVRESKVFQELKSCSFAHRKKKINLLLIDPATAARKVVVFLFGVSKISNLILIMCHNSKENA